MGLTNIEVKKLRPTTVGELLESLAKGIDCEVVATQTGITTIKLNGWLNFKAFKTYPSVNEGWDVFESEVNQTNNK